MFIKEELVSRSKCVDVFLFSIVSQDSYVQQQFWVVVLIKIWQSGVEVETVMFSGVGIRMTTIAVIIIEEGKVNL